MPTRSVIGTIRKPDGTPWPEAEVSFRLMTATASDDATFPRETVTATADASGVFSATLESDLPAFWAAMLPDKTEFRFVLPANGAEPVNLATLQTIAQAPPSALASLEAVASGLAEDISAVADDLAGTQGDLASHVVLPATDATLGHIRVGENLTIDGAGVLSAEFDASLLDDLAAQVDDIEGTVSLHIPRVATEEDLGHVRMGPTLLLNRYRVDLAAHDGNLAAAIAALPDGGANGGEVRIYGEWAWPGMQVIPSGVQILGAGPEATRLTLPHAADFVAFDLDGVADVVLADFAVDLEGDPGANNSAIRVRGPARDVLIERVVSNGLGNGFYVAGDLGSTPGIVERLTLRSAVSRNARTSDGFQFNAVDQFAVLDCWAEDSWRDGFKFQRQTKNGVIRGGGAVRNGVGVLTLGSAWNGEGIDAYAGGDALTIDTFLAQANRGNGVNIKSVTSQDVDPSTHGYVRRVFLTNVRALDNVSADGVGGHGLFAGAANATPPDYPLTAHITINSGEYRGNEATGMRLDGRGMVVTGGPQISHNGTHGIHQGPKGFDLLIADAHIFANSQSVAGGFDGVRIDGQKATLASALINGVDAGDVMQVADYDSLTRWHAHSVRVGSTANDVVISDQVRGGYAVSRHVRVDMTTGVCIVDHITDLAPNSGALQGGKGSRVRRVIGGGAFETWIKGDTAPNALTGWTRQLVGHQGSSQTLNFPEIAAGTSESLTVATGVASNVVPADVALATPPSNLPVGLIPYAWCETNAVRVTLYNATGGTIDPPAGTWRVAVLKT